MYRYTFVGENEDSNFLNKITYADNAATTPIDDEVLNLMIELQKKYFANPSAVYKISKPVKKISNIAKERGIIFRTAQCKQSDIFRLTQKILIFCQPQHTNLTLQKAWGFYLFAKV